MPVLEVDGVRINQSRVICAYVAKQLGVSLNQADLSRVSQPDSAFSDYFLLRARCFCSELSSANFGLSLTNGIGKTLHTIRVHRSGRRE